MIKPTVGRIVWYRPDEQDRITMSIHEGGQPLSATVCHVWSDTCVNLSVIDSDGGCHKRTSVTLRQSDEPWAGGRHCEWMPYQKGQAAKTEELERSVKEGFTKP